MAEFDGAGAFGPVLQLRVPWTATQTVDGVQQFFRSFSSWMALEPDTRTTLLGEVGALVDHTFGGAVERPFLTAVYSAQRR
ncbi:MAG: hypothetical protein AAFP84_02635 [Actinomycetota bacterium]